MAAEQVGAPPDWVWLGGEERCETERPFELSIIRAEDNVRVALVLLLLLVGYTAPNILTNPTAFSLGLMIGSLLSIWTRYEADWVRMRRIGSLAGGAVVVVLGDLVWLSLIALGSGGLVSPFAALLVVPILYSVALFSRMRYAVTLVTGMVVLIFITLATTSVLNGWMLGGMLLAVLSLAWVAQGICHVLERERRTNELVLRNMSEGILLLDSSRRVVIANRQFERLTSVPVHDIVGLRAEELASDETLQPLNDILSEVASPVQGPATVTRELPLDLPDPVDLRITTERCLGPIGESVGYVVVCQDVTPIKSVMRLKEAGLSMLSHEIRSPLTTLRVTASMLSALANGVSDEKVTRFAEILDCETQRLVWIAGELLNAAHLEDPQCHLNIKPCDVDAMVQRVRRIVDVSANDHGVQITGEQSGDLSAIPLDGDRMQSALHRLCENALKYTDEGGTVTVSAERRDGELRISVADTGHGIPEEKLEVIFEKFAQLEDDTTRERAERGTGLGLYVVNRIIELHGGRLEVESEVGVGSTFTICIPTGPESEAPVEYRDEQFFAAK